ncbi:MAG: bifunctional enoyl-CoA hydratase/phosphate acetyltransferase [Chloroflexi bacterium]|nr:bifunctional enoyl-CoA hydratase/phosphate acetyltransferase [Chloroflexota bacterium]MCL5110282.1 bifunctional enoyl-CoA hydratase/phosphate acetyltransferase [Chloroflexota bacterium]
MPEQPLRDFASLIEEARRFGPKRMSVAVAQEREIIRAVKEGQDLGLVQAVLVGDGQEIAELAAEEGLSLAPGMVIDEPDWLLATRKSVELAARGEVDLIMKGKANTADLIRAVLDREIGLRTGRQLSGTIVFEVPTFERLMVLSDASINIAPTLLQKAEMIQNAVATARAVGIRRPKVAALTAFEFINPEMPATIDAANLTLMARRGQIKDCIVEGPIALDLALSQVAAEQKGFQSPVTGQADVFLCPDIEAANIMLRCIIYLANGKVGGVIQGAKVPIILISRAEPAETKVNSMALALLASLPG